MSVEFEPETPTGKILTRAFGEQNVEEACVMIAKMCDNQGRRVSIKPTYAMVRNVLEAVHGRPEPGQYFISDGVVTRRGEP